MTTSCIAEADGLRRDRATRRSSRPAQAYPEPMALHKEVDREPQRPNRSRAAGGLFIIGTERHESRRIDNQLRGRSGRQGDPGETRFYLSLEDDLMRLFGARARSRT